MRAGQEYPGVHWHPMVAAGLWKRDDIDRMEAQLFREVNGLPNVISSKAILNVA